MTGVKIWSDCAFSQPIGAGQLEHGRNRSWMLRE